MIRDKNFTNLSWQSGVHELSCGVCPLQSGDSDRVTESSQAVEKGTGWPAGGCKNYAHFPHHNHGVPPLPTAEGLICKLSQKIYF